MVRSLLGVALFVVAATSSAADLPEFRRSPWFDESVRERWVADGVRVVVIAPPAHDAAKPTRLVVYATPNGNTIEQTLGSATATGLDWHFDIQHVAAQVRTLRAATPGENVVLACVEADTLSWPAWKRNRKDGPAVIRNVVETVRGWLPGKDVRIALTGHSGGGSFLFGYLDAADDIPATVERIVFLDANYSYSDADKHGDKLVAWLKGSPTRRLVVIAYDDRNVTFDGKPVVGPTGGTYRATERMVKYFSQQFPLTESTRGDFVNRVGFAGQAAFHVHANPQTKILHTALVGEMNGLLRGLTDETALGSPRAYTKWVQPAPGIPTRPADAPGGAAVFRTLEAMTPAAREEAIAAEVIRGNVPDFLRTFHKLTLRAKGHTAVVEVMPDYLAVGSDADFVRVPMTPQTASRIADAFGCSLPTRKLVDEVYRSATVKLEPHPLTQDRDAVKTFAEHHAIIERQRAGRKLGELVAGIKKDVVVTNRLDEKANRVAIYGWHKLDGSPIQPLNVSHVNWYVDYSHGVRLVRRTVVIDGRPRDIRHVLSSADLAGLVSDEGVIARSTY